jgi:hypothetical protein
MRGRHMPWWGWLIAVGGLLIWITIVAVVVVFFHGAKKLNEKFDREQEELRTVGPYGVRRRG